MEQMICENCVFFSPWAVNGDDTPICHESDSPDWWSQPDNYCSEGQWLILQDWVNQDDQNTKLLFLGSYDELYFRFAERQMMSNTPNFTTGCDDELTEGEYSDKV